MAKQTKSPKGTNLLPLLILFIVLCVLLVVGFVVYTIVQDIADKTSKKMEKKNITFSREGMKVGVKEVSTEKYGDKTQNVLVNMWNNASFQSRFAGWGQPTPPASTASTPAATPGVGTEKRKPFSRSASSQQSIKR